MSSSSTSELRVGTVKLEPRGNYIDGRWVAAAGGATMHVVNPATGESIASVARSSRDDVDRAVAAARRARDSWAQSTPGERAEMLLALAEAVKVLAIAK